MSLLLAAVIGKGQILSVVRAIKDVIAQHRSVAEGSPLKLNPQADPASHVTEAGELYLQIARMGFFFDTRCRRVESEALDLTLWPDESAGSPR
jgi:hypothetical protein